MSLTVTEREHWSNLIRTRVTERIEDLWNQAGPLKRDLQAQAREEILQEAGVTETMEVIKVKQAEVDKLVSELHDLRLGVIRRLDTDNERGYYAGDERNFESTVNQVTRSRISTRYRELAAKTPVGAAVARLERESRRATDSVYLATSPTGIKVFWEKLLKILNAEPSELERMAMDLPSEP